MKAGAGVLVIADNNLNDLNIKNTFHKQERLYSRKQIELLFKKNKSVNVFPLKAVFMQTEAEQLKPVQAMFVAPKRNFKRAHDRNKLKRRMREAYRLNKQAFYEALIPENKKMAVAFIYVAKKQEAYTVIEAAVIKILQTITKKTEG